MVTKNIRAVTYLPPEYHQQFKHFAKRENLTESGALVEIVKQFFEENSPQNNSPDRTMIEEIVREQLAGTEAEIVTLKAQMEQIQQLLAGMMSGKTTARKTRSTPSFVKPKLQPLKAGELANRLLRKKPAGGTNTSLLGVKPKISNESPGKNGANFIIPYDSRTTRLFQQL